MSEFTELDARRLLCPMPVIRMQDKIRTLKVGDVIRVTCTDPGAKHDIPAWCRVHGHDVIDVADKGSDIVISVRVCEDASPRPGN